ncbi:DNA/RNA helicase domain-containing protein [Negativibacillus massiliensis]|uniref:DNA/RNA helicase domain-containing protein n=1 Tax=Negativibacillus massiliensis TaxID=1871035 RepID=UPI003AF2F7E2
MLIYTGTKAQFNQDVITGDIASKIKQEFYSHCISHNNDSEYNSWENSMKEMYKVMKSPFFPDNVQVAVEYQIPQTSKRVDFLIGGLDEFDNEHVIVIELKQWSEAQRTHTDGIVKTYTAGAVRAVAHPSYQAYSYAKTIESYNATIQDDNVQLHPCAYLHNYKTEKLSEISNDFYQEIVNLAPLYIENQTELLQTFIKKYIVKAPKCDLLFKIDNGRIRPSKALQDTLVAMLAGNEEFIMIDEQKIVYEAVKKLVDKSQKNGEKYTVIVEGGPGTGKSVVAIQLLADLIADKKLVVSYVTKNAAPRNVYFEKLKQGKAKNNYVKALFKSSGNFIGVENNMFDCLLVDEAHRLNAKSGIFKNLGENQIKEIINASKVSVFFIDENQIVTADDIGTVAEIKKWANILGSKVYHGEQYKLSSQFRCNGSDEYIAFVDDLLEIKKSRDSVEFDMNYEIKLFDNPNEMRKALYEKNKERNKARMIAGYCYEWISKKDINLYDIQLEDNFKAKWNFSSTSTWAIDEDSFDQVGCIHTSQGLEFDYVGVIIGNDLRYVNGRVITDASCRAKSDQSIRGLRKNPDKQQICDTIIRNTYKTLLTRGQKGCYIYCENKALQDYFKSKIVNSSKTSQLDF